MDDRRSAPTAPDSGAYGAPADGAYPPPPQANRGRGFTIAAFVLSAIALAFFPIVTGPVGAVLGFVGYSKGDPHGRLAGFTAILCTVVGIVLGVVVLKNLRS
jgi:hypothetical protein